MTDLVLVSLGTTLGWRVADELFLEQVERAGATTAAVGVDFGLAGKLRRGYPANDLVEALAARRATLAAIERHSPRAVVLCTTTASLLAHPLPVPYAVRLDAPAHLNRTGARNAALHPLERRALAQARLVLPWSQAAKRALPAGQDHAIVVPPPIEPSPPGDAPERGPLAVAYVPDPHSKGLDIACTAWSGAAVPHARLEIFGVDEQRGLAYLAAEGISAPPATTWRGLTSPSAFRAALRRARLYIGAARWEDFGQAPLEALADGALLATVPSGGPFEALQLARELQPELVTNDIDPAQLATAIHTAFALPEPAIAAYQRAAAQLLAPYRTDQIDATIKTEVLPALLG